MSISAVTKAIARLEDELGTQLFTRTTRQLRTTEYGQQFYESCVRLLSALEDAEIAVQRNSRALKGRVRAVLLFSFRRVTVVPELPAFYARHPDITLDLSFSDGPVDIVGDGYDVAVRTGEIDDSRLTTRLLMKSIQVTVASPSYLEKHDVPQTPEDLKHHNCIVGRFGSEWGFKLPDDGSRFSVRVQGNTVINSGDALREAAVAGLGIVQGTWFLARKDLERGAVQSILTDYALEGTPIALLYPANRHLPLKTRVFLDFLIEITRTALLLNAIVSLAAIKVHRCADRSPFLIRFQRVSLGSELARLPHFSQQPRYRELHLMPLRSRARNTAKASRRGRPAPTGALKPLLIIDGDSFAHRSYHALPQQSSRSKGGRPEQFLALRTACLASTNLNSQGRARGLGHP